MIRRARLHPTIRLMPDDQLSPDRRTLSSALVTAAASGMVSTGAIIIALLEYRRAFLLARSSVSPVGRHRAASTVTWRDDDHLWMPFYSMQKPARLTV
ncbi:MAG: hypothetical protein IT353_21090 [Gemmatimonadaceae bacterium]|nr:hypothetical protein [Gemmatimonadaceae bacterium]